MKTPEKILSNVTRSRVRMREAGLRPVQFWVPDTRRPEFSSEIREQCMALKDDPQEAETIAFAGQAAREISGWK